MNYRIQTCGWPRGCFDEAGNQIYTPRELEEAVQNDPVGPCPSGVCVPMGHGHNLTGVSLEDYQAAREAETNARLDVLRQGGRQGRQAPEPQRLSDGGEWVRIGGQEVRQDAPVHRSLWDVLLGK